MPKEESGTKGILMLLRFLEDLVSLDGQFTLKNEHSFASTLFTEFEAR